MIDYKVLRAKKALIGNLPMGDPFFDSLKSDYPGFEEWLKRKASESAYVSFDPSRFNIEAFLYLKIENEDEQYNDINPVFAPKRRLKVGTFKVSRNGVRLGERFIKIVFDNAVAENVDEIYVTIFDRTDNQKRLIDLLTAWGFEHWGNKGYESVFVRPLRKLYQINKLQECYPIVKANRVFLMPINPDYHTGLFPDSILNNESRLDFVEDSTYSNGITKNYISHSHVRNVRKGDLIVVYRTGGYHKSVVTTLCEAAEDSHICSNFEELISYAGSLTIFNENELKKEWDKYKDHNRPFVQRLLHIFSFPKRPTLAALIDRGVIADVNSAPRGFTEITQDQLRTVLHLAGQDESFIIY